MMSRKPRVNTELARLLRRMEPIDYFGDTANHSCAGVLQRMYRCAIYNGLNLIGLIICVLARSTA